MFALLFLIHLQFIFKGSKAGYTSTNAYLKDTLWKIKLWGNTHIIFSALAVAGDGYASKTKSHKFLLHAIKCLMFKTMIWKMGICALMD